MKAATPVLDGDVSRRDNCADLVGRDVYEAAVLFAHVSELVIAMLTDREVLTPRNFGVREPITIQARVVVVFNRIGDPRNSGYTRNISSFAFESGIRGLVSETVSRTETWSACRPLPSHFRPD